MKPDPAASSGMSAWQAFPASSSRAASPPNSSNRSTAGVSMLRTKDSPPTRGSRTAACSPARSGGMGEVSASTT